MMFKKVLVLTLLFVLVAAAFAAAAELPVSGGTIQAGVDDTLYCDPDGVYVPGWGLETDDNTVRSVRIAGIHPDCAGNEMFVKIYGPDPAAKPLYSGQMTLTGADQETFRFSAPYLRPQDIVVLKIWIEGEF